MLPYAWPAITLLLAATPPAAQLGYRGFNPAFMDTATPPAKDFYQYAVGRWLDSTAIPADYSR